MRRSTYHRRDRAGDQIPPRVCSHQPNATLTGPSCERGACPPAPGHQRRAARAGSSPAMIVTNASHATLTAKRFRTPIARWASRSYLMSHPGPRQSRATARYRQTPAFAQKPGTGDDSSPIDPPTHHVACPIPLSPKSSTPTGRLPLPQAIPAPRGEQFLYDAVA